MTTKVKQILLTKKNKIATINSKEFQSETDILNFVAEILNNGTDIIELKEKQLSTVLFIQLAKKLRDLTAVFNSLLIIYDRVDIAKLVNADGVTLDKNCMSVKEAMKLTEESLLIGFHADTFEQATIAEQSGADFIITAKKFDNLNIKIFNV